MSRKYRRSETMDYHDSWLSIEDSNVIKGVAILFMIFCHLFGNNNGYQDLVINGENFSHILYRACYPVYFY